jgi:hypothetical protein
MRISEKTYKSGINKNLLIVVLIVALISTGMFMSPVDDAYAIGSPAAETLVATINNYDPDASGTEYEAGALQATASGNTVTVSGTVANATNFLKLNIVSGITVVWDASLTKDSYGSALEISGNGTFTMSSETALIRSLAADGQSCAIWAITDDYPTFNIENGTISSNTTAIRMQGGILNVSGGIIEGAMTPNSPSYAIHLTRGTNSLKSSLNISGGVIRAYSSNRIGNDDYGSSVIMLNGGWEINDDISITGGSIYDFNPSPNVPLVRVSMFTNIYLGENIDFGLGFICDDIVYQDEYGGINGYYTGDNADKFDNSTFAEGVNLFKLDKVALTAKNLPYIYNTFSPTGSDVIATLSDKLNMTGITPTVNNALGAYAAPSPNEAFVRFDKSMNINNISLSVANAKIVGTDIPVSFTTVPFGVNIDKTIIDPDPIPKPNIEPDNNDVYNGDTKTPAKILPKKTSVSKLTVGKKQIKATWKKVSGTTKYEVRYRVKGSSKWKTKSVSGKINSLKITKLKKGKTYQVQVRSYKTVSKAKYYSEWSKVKTSKKVK